ncbi:MAG: hypothetical protein N2Z21_10985, partial [Candidatus Sumerlaeaceae bacterium]|nr:hypothetical protein [Candidatus Sumerlaeaceae bacterium]
MEKMVSSSCGFLSRRIVETLAAGLCCLGAAISGAGVQYVEFSDIDPWTQPPQIVPTVPTSRIIRQIQPHVWETIDVADGNPNDGVVRLPGQKLRIDLSDEDTLYLRHVLDVSGVDGVRGVDAQPVNGGTTFTPPTNGGNGTNAGAIYLRCGFVITDGGGGSFKLNGGKGGRGGDSREPAAILDPPVICEPYGEINYVVYHSENVPPGGNGGNGGDAGILVLDVLYWGPPTGIATTTYPLVSLRGGDGGDGGNGCVMHPEVFVNGLSVTGLGNGG